MPNTDHCCRKRKHLAFITGQPKHPHCSKDQSECEDRKARKFTQQYSGQIPVHNAAQTQDYSVHHHLAG